MPLVLALAALSFASPPAVPLGRSTEGRPIRAVRLGDPSAERKVLVVGSIHGDESAGIDVMRRLRRMGGVRGADIWLVDTVNPDGLRRGRRQNARGVDLNRNFPYHWRRRGGRYNSGPRPLSERESRIVRKLVLRIHPAVSIWYHQPWGHVVLPPRGRGRVERRYARLAHFPVRKLIGARANLPGTVVSWQNHRFPGTTAFVVELGARRLSGREIARHARAASAVARGRG